MRMAKNPACYPKLHNALQKNSIVNGDQIRIEHAELRLTGDDPFDARHLGHAFVKLLQLAIYDLGERAIRMAVELAEEIDLAEGQPRLGETIAVWQEEIRILG